MLHQRGEEGGVKSPSKGTETLTLLKLTELSSRLLLNSRVRFVGMPRSPLGHAGNVR